MPTVAAPAASDFKARYPAFAPVADALVDLVIAEAVAAVDTPHWIETDVPRARLLLVAHRLTLEGEPLRSQNAAGQQLSPADAAANGVRKFQVGDVSMEFAGAPQSPSGETGGEFGLTAYGRQYLELLRNNFRGARLA